MQVALHKDKEQQPAGQPEQAVHWGQIH
jgi:hypothetical protein